MSRRGGFRDTSSAVENISLDAVALSLIPVVDGKGGALSAFPLNVDEASVADAGVGVDIQDLVFVAGGSADGVLGVVVVGSHAVGAHSLDQVEIFQANAYSVDEFLVEEADDGFWLRGGGRGEGQSAFSVDQDVSACADAGGGGEVVGGVGGTDVADAADEVEANCANTSVILVDLVSAAGWYDIGERNTCAVGEVVPYHANALAEHIIIDLVDGAVDGGGSWAMHWRTVAAVRSEGVGGDGGAGTSTA